MLCMSIKDKVSKTRLCFYLFGRSNTLKHVIEDCDAFNFEFNDDEVETINKNLLNLASQKR